MYADETPADIAGPIPLSPTTPRIRTHSKMESNADVEMAYDPEQDSEDEPKGKRRRFKSNLSGNVSRNLRSSARNICNITNFR